MGNFNSNAKLLQKSPRIVDLKNSINKKENEISNMSIDNNEAESNLDLSLGESFSSNFNVKDTNFPNHMINSTTAKSLNILQNELPQKKESDLDKLINSNLNNLNALNLNSNNSNLDVYKNISNLTVNLNSIQENLINNLSQSNSGNFGNSNINQNLEIIKEHIFENENEDEINNEGSLDNMINNYNRPTHKNDIRSKSIMNPSYFLNNQDGIYKKYISNPMEDKTNQNKIEVLIKNNKIDTNLDNISNRLSARTTPSMKIDQFSNNETVLNNNNLKTTKQETKLSAYSANIGHGNKNFEVSKKIAVEIINNNINENDKNNNNNNKISSNDSVSQGNAIDDIVKKYGILVDENTAEVLPLNKNEKSEEILLIENHSKTSVQEKNDINKSNHLNNNNNNPMDFDNIRKSVLKMKESDLQSLEKELKDKEEKLLNNNKKKDVNLLDFIMEEQPPILNTNLDKVQNSLIENSYTENNVLKSDSFSSKVQKILDSGDKSNFNNYINSNQNAHGSSLDNQRRNTSFQLQNNSNKTVLFYLETNNDSNLLSDKNLINNNIKAEDNLGARRTTYQPASYMNLTESSDQNKNNIPEGDSDDLENKTKEKAKRNSGIFMKRVKNQNQEKDENLTNNIISNNENRNSVNQGNNKTLESNKNSSYHEKLLNTYLNDVNLEDEEFNRTRRNTNITAQNKLSLNSINLNAEFSKSKEEPIKITNLKNTINNLENSINDSKQNNNNISENINNNLEKSTNEINDVIKPRNSTDIRLNKKSIDLNIEEINLKERNKEIEVLPQETPKSKRVSGLMKRPKGKDFKINENHDEGNEDIDVKENSMNNSQKERFIKKLNANLLKRGNYNDYEESEGKEDKKCI